MLHYIIADPSDEDSSSDESNVPAKRPRADTYGASSTTSHGSGNPNLLHPAHIVG